ncbi:hypothetical protein BD413DRAFT_198543 [Trametes elegans]|nr:hypothetical protein BD413DRAFT_198543 [Trametes elegans]
MKKRSVVRARRRAALSQRDARLLRAHLRVCFPPAPWFAPISRSGAVCVMEVVVSRGSPGGARWRMAPRGTVVAPRAESCQLADTKVTTRAPPASSRRQLWCPRG